MKVRILFLVATFENESDRRIALTLARALNPKQFEIYAACMFKGGPLANEFRQCCKEVVSFNMRNIFDARVIYRIYSFLKKNRIRILHTHLLRSDLYGGLAGKLAGLPIILSTKHNMNSYTAQGKLIHSFLFRLSSYFPTHIIAVSEALKSYFISMIHVKREKIFLIHNGIPIDKFSSEFNIHTADKLNSSNTSFKVGFLGRLVREKGLAYLLHAFHQLNAKDNLTLFIVGEGPQKTFLQKLCRKLEITDNVQFLGYRTDIEHILSLLDLVVLPSISEGLPMVLLEALSAAKPVIATRVGGIPEIIKHGKTGILIPPRDAAAISQAIMQIIQNPTLARTLARNGHRFVKNNFNQAKMIKQYNRIYSHCINHLPSAQNIKTLPKPNL